MKAIYTATLILTLICAFPSIRAQTGGHILFGDVKVDEGNVTGVRPISFDIILYKLSGNIVARQTVNSNGRYGFIGLPDGQYDLVVEMENVEIARLRVEVISPNFKIDYRQDIYLEWRTITSSGRQGSISAADFYGRTPNNQDRFSRAQKEIDKKNFEVAVTLLKELLSDEPKDFQAWSELGTVYLLKQSYDESEKAYLKSIAQRPTFFLALMNLARLRTMRGNYSGAIIPLVLALKVRPDSADANYQLGEVYLQLRKGSIAVDYLYKALLLDPVGKANAHLRLAALYNAVGLKQKAAAEYAAFLKKKPDYVNRRKLEQYIALNKGRTEASRR